ncbi:hypothetical protein L484_011707 [Morus notabilis]|uniref:Uncharacterized protein n=1 Tax=Morus notabilis TaxID=981085 RepID=W9RUB5_9ROSA|nr:hypothetical protein L484_011707 [Morus notabilis]
MANIDDDRDPTASNNANDNNHGLATDGTVAAATETDLQLNDRILAELIKR